MADRVWKDKKPIWNLQVTYRVNQFILDDPLILYHEDPEKSADMFPDMSADALAIIIVKTPTTTSIQLNTTTIDVGFDTIMTVHTPPHQELYSRAGSSLLQDSVTQS